MIERKQTPFEKAGYTKDTKFKCLVNYGEFNKGDVVTLHEDDGTMSPEFIDSEGNVHYMMIPTSDEAELEVLVEASIKVEPTLFPIGTEVKIAKSSQYYKCEGDYNPINTKGKIVLNHSPYGDDFTYRVEWSNGCFNSYKLNDLVLWEEEPPVASQEAITDVSNSKPSVGIDSSDSGYKEPTEPLVSITKEVKYTVTIKGIDFTFTQDELSELTEELLGFSDDF